MSLECCPRNNCLLAHDKGQLRQNGIHVSCDGKRNIISYHMKDNTGLKKVKKWKVAFMRVFGIGKKKISVLLKKVQPFSGYVLEDQRRFTQNQRKIPLRIKAEVVEHFRSYDRSQSHYARAFTKEKQYLSSNLSLSQLWRDFLAKKGIGRVDIAPLSFTSFRRIFKTFSLSFRKPHVDTCPNCDSFQIIIRHGNA
ncbi:uncharacterized protein LOC116611750 [Nematostella vectensis]|uniref:uncharacterized protein LOC116611750 n=1 Tax=Nematostella vectensis TaxID=45351 RepID=UPI002076E7D8|nr:uncharacterized protein LOC116611750 [Nematostella vectensis]